MISEIIETYWNVNEHWWGGKVYSYDEIIETYWNVNEMMKSMVKAVVLK